MYTFWASENYLSRESFFSGKLSIGRVTVLEEFCLFGTWAVLLFYASIFHSEISWLKTLKLLVDQKRNSYDEDRLSLFT